MSRRPLLIFDGWRGERPRTTRDVAARRKDRPARVLMPAGASDSDVLGALVERSSAATKVQAVMRGSSARKKSATSKRESTGEVCWRTAGGLGVVGWDGWCGWTQHG